MAVFDGVLNNVLEVVVDVIGLLDGVPVNSVDVLLPSVEDDVAVIDPDLPGVRLL